MRLIDADDYKPRLQERIECQCLKSIEKCIAHDIEILDGMPTVDAVPVVHAHWDLVPIPDKNDIYEYHCSNCHKGYYIAKSNNEMPYCNQCGAKMDGEKIDIDEELERNVMHH